MIWLLLACTGPSPDAPPEVAARQEGGIPAPTRPQPPPDARPGRAEGIGDPYHVIAGPEIRDGELWLQASHGGGCEDHEWSLNVLSREGEVARAAVAHDANEDRCRAILRPEVRVPLDFATCTRELVVVVPLPETQHRTVSIPLDPPVGCP